MSKDRILVVEDEAIIALEIESSLQNLGYEVTSVVNSGDKAIQKAEEDKPDLILMDIRIQGDKDGIETAEIIRSRFGIPVVFSTAYLDEERIERAKITMPFGYVLKPIQERDLKVTLEMALYVAKVDAERRKAESEVVSQVDFLDSIMEQSPFAMWISDTTGTVIKTNKALRELLNLTDQQIVGHYNVLEDVNLEVQGVMSQVKSVFTQHKTAKFNIPWFSAKAGSDNLKEARNLWIDVTIFPILNKEGNLLNAVCQWIDITERKQMEDALKKSEEWFSTTLRSIGDAVITTDKKSAVTSLNPIAEKLTGWRQEEAKGKPLLEIFNIINEETRKPVENPVQKVLKEDRIVGLANHTILIAKDGTEIPIDDSGSPIRSEQGEIYGVVLVFRDIIERKNSEEALRESEEKHRTLFETMTQGVVYQNAEGIITDANPAAERILGLSLGQLQGKTSMDPRWKAIHEDGSDFPGEEHPIPVALRTGKTVKNVIHGIFHPDTNEYRWIRVNAVPKFKKGESIPYEAYAIFDDITEERKRKE